MDVIAFDPLGRARGDTRRRAVDSGARPDFAPTATVILRRLQSDVRRSSAAALGGFVRTLRSPGGRLARTGTVAAFAGCALLIAGNVAEFWLVLAQSKPSANAAYQSGAEEVWIGSEIGWMLFLLGFLILSIGLVLFGVAAIRANELPRWRALPLMVGAAGLTAFLLGPFVVAAADLLLTLIGIGWILLGYVLWTGRVNEPGALRLPDDRRAIR